MKIIKKEGCGTIATSITDINNREMEQMCELKNHIKDVLDSHKPNAKEKKYINDDDLKLAHAMLSVFTKEFSAAQKESAFDAFLKEQAAEKPAEKTDGVDKPETGDDSENE